MDGEPRNNNQEQKVSYSAASLGRDRQAEVNPRRQDKIIAAVVRGNGKLLLEDSVSLKGERASIVQRTREESGGRTVQDSELEKVLREVPTVITTDSDGTRTRVAYSRFSGETPDKVRMRRVVAFVTKGSLAGEKDIGPNDLKTFLSRRGNAVRFEQIIPEILQEVGPQGVDTYLPIIDEVGKDLYGSQWVYLQQFRLAEQGVISSPDQTNTETRQVQTELDQRLARFNEQEKVRLPNIPPVRVTVEELQKSKKTRTEGHAILCLDKSLDAENRDHVVAGYDKQTNEVLAFKKTSASGHERSAAFSGAPAGELAEDVVKKTCDDEYLLTYKDKVQRGDEVIRSYPLASTDLQRYLIAEGALNQKQALGITIGVAQGVRELHKHGMYHFDVATSNVLIDAKGDVKLADLDGVLFSLPPGRERHFSRGGNVFIQAPEVYEDAVRNEAAVDIYEATTLLYQTITGESPFAHIPWNPGEDPAIRQQRFYDAHKNADYSMPEHLPEDVKKIIRRGLAPDTQDRYQSMDEMLADLLTAFDAKVSSTPEGTPPPDAESAFLLRQETFSKTTEISPRLRNNPNAVLDVAEESVDYLLRQDSRYLLQLEQLGKQIEQPMSSKTEAAVCIPVAGPQESQNIHGTLERFANQTVSSDTYEIILLVNSSESASQKKKNEIDKTLSEIDRAKKDFPDLPVRVVSVTIPDEQVRIGNLRKIATDLALVRAQEAGITRDLLLISNDADNEGVATDYIESYIDYFNANPDKEAAVGNLQYDPQTFIRLPSLAIATEFSTRLDQHGFKNGNVMLFGGNSVMKSSIYAGIGGYPHDIHAEQSWTTQTIREIRKGNQTFGFVENSVLVTSARRIALSYLENTTEQIAFGDKAAEERMRKLDISELPIVDFDNPAVVKELHKTITDQVNDIVTKYESGEHLGKNSWYYRTNLEALGITYKVEGDPKSLDSRIVITDSSGYINKLKAMRDRIVAGETNMANVFVAA